VLLAVASLSYAVEWWEAEKQFWNFGDNDDEQDEVLLFIMKPADDHIPPPAPTPQLAPEGSSLTPILSYKSNQRKRPRDEVRSLIIPQPEPSKAAPSKTLDTAEFPRVLVTERLRLQAETAQNRNVVIKLSLWVVVVGYVHRFILSLISLTVPSTDLDELLGTRIFRFLAPKMHRRFRLQRRRCGRTALTLEVRFYLQIEPYDERKDPNSALYQLMHYPFIPAPALKPIHVLPS
jgi:serine/threonine-protein kinase RIM15